MAGALAAAAVPAVGDAGPGASDSPKRLPAGAAIAGVAVGGLGPVGAERELRRVLAARYDRRITVRVGPRDRSLSPRRAGLVVDYNGMLARAFELAGRGAPVTVRLARSISGKRLSSAIVAVGRPFYRAPRNARARFGIARVVRIRHRAGRGLDGRRLRRALLAELRHPTRSRVVKASRRRLRPAITLSKLGRVHHTYVSVDRASFKLRLFKRLRLVRTYPVAVGMAGFDTPGGLRRVLSKTVNPAWHAPKKPWAGAYAGQTIPYGDPRNPLKARFISLGDGVGMHGTAEEWTIGTRASHGCIRMRVRDVKLLYPRVPVGTPVMIR